jgi:hypothetical protein
MGGAKLNNVVVLVLDDANLNITLASGPIRLNGIIDYPVFQAPGRITFLHDGEFETGGLEGGRNHGFWCGPGR